MSPIFITSIALIVLAQITLPRKYAFAPLILATLNLGNLEVVNQLTPVRIVVLTGLVRLITSGSIPFERKSRIDLAFALFAFFAILSAPFSDPPHNPYTERIGLILNVLGAYAYGRGYFTGSDLLNRVATIVGICVVPLGLLSTLEVISGKNFYYPHFGGRGAFALARDGEFRARGPFGHAILCGTAGAVCMPIVYTLIKQHKKMATLGLIACAATIVSANSSGPIASALIAIGVIYAWRWRNYVPYAKWAILGGIIFLSLYMNRPFYYIIDSIDFTGGSTGWHRARLIEMSIKHLDEWWLFGTDYTRHWMPTGVSWSPNHTDLTNYYIHLGVLGGAPLMMTLIIIVASSLRRLVKLTITTEVTQKTQRAYRIWCLIAALLAHASSCVAISYFDQMFSLFYLTIALSANINAQDFSNDV